MTTNVGNLDIGLVVGFIGGIVAFFQGFRAYRVARVLQDTPETPIRSIAMGFVRIHGKAKSDQLVIQESIILRRTSQTIWVLYQKCSSKSIVIVAKIDIAKDETLPYIAQGYFGTYFFQAKHESAPWLCIVAHNSCGSSDGFFVLIV